MARAKPKDLTSKGVAALRSNGKPQQFYDGKQPGLVLRVSPRGDRLSWSVVYKGENGKKQRTTLRGADAADLDAARKAAKRILGQVEEGRDPAAARRAAKTAPSLGDLIDKYVASLPQDMRSRDEVKRRLLTYVKPVLGSTKAAALKKDDIGCLFDKLKATKPATANRTHDDLKACLNWAVTERGLIDVSPMARMKRPAETTARERVLSAQECKTILERLPSAAMSQPLKHIVELLLLTACRASEIAELKKSEIELDDAQIRLPMSRTKNKRVFVVPLPARALCIIRSALPAAEQSPFLFPSPRDYAKPIDGHAVSTALRRAQEHFAIPQWTAHDFRRAVATRLGEREDGAVEPHVIDRILNHVRQGVTEKHYNHANYLSAHRAALNLWCAMLE